jgi:hypothetical protein
MGPGMGPSGPGSQKIPPGWAFRWALSMGLLPVMGLFGVVPGALGLTGPVTTVKTTTSATSHGLPPFFWFCYSTD